MANSTNQTNESYTIILQSTTVSSPLFSTSFEDTKIIKEIQASHAHDARELDVIPILSIIEDIFQRAKLDDASNNDEVSNDLADALAKEMSSVTAGPKGTMLEALAATIQKICCEFSCKCDNVHGSTMAILNMLGDYSWDAKVVITLAAFAVTYAELWLIIHLRISNNPLAKSIAVLKQTPGLSVIDGALKPQLATVNYLLTIVVDVAKSLNEFRSLPSKYITPEDAPLATSMNQIASACYWSVRTIVACGARVINNMGIPSGLASSTAEAWDLSSLTLKEKSVNEQLRQKLTLCYEFIETKKKEEAYKNLELLFQTTQKDNVKIFEALINCKSDIAPLVKVSRKHCDSPKEDTTESVVNTEKGNCRKHHQEESHDCHVKRVPFDVLQGKIVLLLISDLDISLEELGALDMIYQESRKKKNEFKYEIVWLPIVDSRDAWTELQEKKSKDLQNNMSWYTLSHPSLLDEVSIRFIKENWGFVQKPIIVSLNSVGKVVNHNALDMMLIWGNSAYPFTTEEEEKNWQKETWKLEFLVDGIHPDIPKWIAKNVHICLFGGEDIEWIRKFSTSMKEHATKAGVKIELLYVGKHNAEEAMKKIIETVKSENIAHTLDDASQVWYFWTRLEAMLYSKMEYGKNVENDNILKEVMSVLSFDGGHQGWASIGLAVSTEIVKGNGQVILNAISKYTEWEELSKKIGYITAFIQYLRNHFHTGSHCNRVELPSIERAGAPIVVYCADCHLPMERYYLYKCCTG